MTRKFLSLMTVVIAFSVSAASAMEDKAERRLDPLSRTPHVLRTPDAGTSVSAPIPVIAEAEDQEGKVVVKQAPAMNLSGVSRTPLVMRGTRANPHIQPNLQDK